MKSELKEAKDTTTKERKYPYIGKYINPEDSEDYVCVLFTGQGTGTVLVRGTDYLLDDVGDYSGELDETVFKVLPSTYQIILQND